MLILDYLALAVLPITIILWPYMILFAKTNQLIQYHLKEGSVKQGYLRSYEFFTNKFLTINFCEVCIESSFNALLQWYIILPQFLIRYFEYEELLKSLKSQAKYGAENESNPQFLITAISFVVSIISLAWSITSNVADQKRGALDMDWNPIPRIILFFSNLCLVFARINSIVVFMYYWGPGEFKPGMIAIGIHILIMMIIHLCSLLPLYRRKTKNSEFPKKLQYLRHLAYVCTINGFTNIMVNNFFEVTLANVKNFGKKPRNLRARHLLGDAIFCLENVIFMSFGFSISVFPLDKFVCKRLLYGVFIVACGLGGLLLKIIYYDFFS